MQTGESPRDGLKVDTTRPIVLVVDDHPNSVDWLLDKARSARFQLYTAQGQGDLASAIAKINALPSASGWIFVDAFLERFGKDFGLLNARQVRLNDEYIAGFLLVEKVLPRVLKHFSDFTVFVISQQDKDYSDRIKRISNFPNCHFSTKETLRAQLDELFKLLPRQESRSAVVMARADQEDISPDSFLTIAKGMLSDFGFPPDRLSNFLGIESPKTEGELRIEIADHRDIRLRIELLLDIVELISMLVVDDAKIAQYIRSTVNEHGISYSDILLRGNTGELFQLKFSLQYSLGGAL